MLPQHVGGMFAVYALQLFAALQQGWCPLKTSFSSFVM
jgi:hypothetical protein